jgi:hypothetical protein
VRFGVYFYAEAVPPAAAPPEPVAASAKETPP